MEFQIAQQRRVRFIDRDDLLTKWPVLKLRSDRRTKVERPSLKHRLSGIPHRCDRLRIQNDTRPDALTEDGLPWRDLPWRDLLLALLRHGLLHHGTHNGEVVGPHDPDDVVVIAPQCQKALELSQ